MAFSTISLSTPLLRASPFPFAFSVWQERQTTRCPRKQRNPPGAPKCCESYTQTLVLCKRAHSFPPGRRGPSPTDTDPRPPNPQDLGVPHQDNDKKLQLLCKIDYKGRQRSKFILQSCSTSFHIICTCNECKYVIIVGNTTIAM